MVGQFAVFEEENGGQATDAHLVGNIFGLFDVKAVKAHFVIKLAGQPFNNRVHDGALAQPIGSKNNEEWLSLPVF